MRFDLFAETNAGHCVVCDEAAIGKLEPNDDIGDALEESERSGRIFVYEMGCNGPCKYTIFLDEEVPEELLKKSYRSVSDVGLILTSGKLTAAGMENLSKSTNPYRIEWAMVPAGQYRLSAFLIKGEEPLVHESRFGLISRWSSYATPVVLFLILCFFAAGDRFFGAVVFGSLVAYWVINFTWYKYSGEIERDVARHAKQFKEGTPSIVMHLTRASGAMPPGGRISE